MSKHVVWAVAAVLIVAAISHYTAQYNVEEAKQKAFMMKACVDAGGEWKRDGWSAYFLCERPRP